jgi:hypothetical protein
VFSDDVGHLMLLVFVFASDRRRGKAFQYPNRVIGLSKDD